MLKQFIFVSLVMISSVINAAPWYRQFYGHYSLGVPVSTQFSYSQQFIDTHKASLDKIEKATSYSTNHDAWLYGWYGAGYRFSPGYSVEVSRFHITTSKRYTFYKGSSLLRGWDAKQFLDKETKIFNLNGGFLTGKIYSRTFRFFRATRKANDLVRIPESVKTEDELEHYLNTQNARKTGWLHTFNFYLQGGIGYYGGGSSYQMSTGSDHPTGFQESTIDNEIGPRPTLVWGVGGQYYLGKYMSLDGAWLYATPLESRRTVDPFHIFKIGLSVYLQ